MNTFLTLLIEQYKYSMEGDSTEAEMLSVFGIHVLPYLFLFSLWNQLWAIEDKSWGTS
jgi:hypothetical protein